MEIDELSKDMENLSDFDYPLSENETKDFINEISSLSDFINISCNYWPIFSLEKNQRDKLLVPLSDLISSLMNLGELFKSQNEE